MNAKPLATTPSLPFSLCRRFLQSHPAFVYFVLTFVISWTGAFCLVAPRLLRGETIPKFTGLMMFPVMLLGPSFTGLFMTWKNGGSSGLHTLFLRMARPCCTARWYAALLIPTALILTTLGILTLLLSPIYRPNSFFVGVSFGVVAGLFEEIGWTGYAFPALNRKCSAMTSAIVLGLLWSAWHIPVVDYLGTVTPHGSWWLEYFVAFTAVMTAIRVLICWVYVSTGSLLMAQLLHAASTGALVALSPPHISAAQEAFWYGVYACFLWLTVGAVCRYSGGLTRVLVSDSVQHSSDCETA
jgi:uncharacterized protein